MSACIRVAVSAWHKSRRPATHFMVLKVSSVTLFMAVMSPFASSTALALLLSKALQLTRSPFSSTTAWKTALRSTRDPVIKLVVWVTILSCDSCNQPDNSSSKHLTCVALQAL